MGKALRKGLWEPGNVFGADHGFTGDALLLLLSGCSRCSSGLLEHYSLLPLFRGIIPAWLVRTSEDRMDVA